MRKAFAAALFVAALIAAVCAIEEKSAELKIVGGEDVAQGTYPWYATTHSSSTTDDPFCGGSLVGDKWILTAAHCWDGSSIGSKVVRLNCADTSNCPPESEIHNIASVSMHPYYNSDTFDYDIALLEMSTTSSFTPVTMITTATNADECPDTQTKAIGFGTTTDGGSQPSILQGVTVPVVASSTCDDVYDITTNMICAGYKEGGKDSCQGDSGGPLFLDSTDGAIQVGVVSFGNGCAKENYYGVYARLSQFTDGVNSVMGGGDWVVGSDFTEDNCFSSSSSTLTLPLMLVLAAIALSLVLIL